MSLPTDAITPSGAISGIVPGPVFEASSWGWAREGEAEPEPVLWRKQQGGLCAGLCPVMMRRRSQQGPVWLLGDRGTLAPPP